VSTYSSALRIALVGDQYNHNEPAHPMIEEVLSAIGVDIRWVSTEIVDGPEVLDSFHGVWVVPGGPYKNQAGVHMAVTHARTAGVPFLGTCGGFFSALLEYAENELRLPEVIGLAENEAKVGPLMVPLVCSIGDRRTPLKLRPDSLLAEVYGRAIGIREVLQCDYGLKPEFMDAAQQGQLRYSAWDPDDAPRALELTDHPFFMATLFQPELSSTTDGVHPILARFLDSASACAVRSVPAWQSSGNRR
jgi:CTP synthase (UTP-ammonia lyase)